MDHHLLTKTTSYGLIIMIPFHHGLTAVSDVVINVTVASIIIIVYTHAAPPGSPVIVDKTSIMLQPIPLKRGHNWKFTASFELS